MRTVYLFKRNGGFYYAQFRDPVTNKITKTLSTHTTDYAQAMSKAYEFMNSDKFAVKQTEAARIMTLLGSSNLSANELISIKMLCENMLFSTGAPSGASLGAVSAASFGAQSGAQPAMQPGAQSGAFINRPTDFFANTLSVADTKPKHKLLDFLANFWDYDKSEYVQDKLAHGKRIGKRHCYEMTRNLLYWRDFFKPEETVEELTPERLKDFEKYLRNRKTAKGGGTLSTVTMDNIIKTGSIAFKWAVKEEYIQKSPFDRLTVYSKENRERGILTNHEVAELFKRGEWKDERARVANLVAMTTGLRCGEILALRFCDLEENRIQVRHAWSEKDGLKTPKNGKSRIVPLLPAVRKELLKLGLKNPHNVKSTERFIFFGTIPEKPIVHNLLNDGLAEALESIGIDEDQRKERNIVFHSWRHYYATTIANKVDERHAQLALGHLSASMTKHYADHKREEEIDIVADASMNIFNELIG